MGPGFPFQNQLIFALLLPMLLWFPLITQGIWPAELRALGRRRQSLGTKSRGA